MLTKSSSLPGSCPFRGAMEVKGPTWVCILAVPFSDWVTWAPLRVADTRGLIRKMAQVSTHRVVVCNILWVLPSQTQRLPSKLHTVCPPPLTSWLTMAKSVLQTPSCCPTSYCCLFIPILLTSVCRELCAEILYLIF